MATLTIGQQLPLERCPHCSVAKPLLYAQWQGQSKQHDGANLRNWCVYACATCGGMVLACAPGSVQNAAVTGCWPQSFTVAEEMPARAREFLTQAVASLHAPSGAVMLTASAVDAMLKDKGLKDGSLFSRIDAAAKNALITAEMAAWAHEIRLDANDQRHADEERPLPSTADATRCIEFASALAQFLYVLPARVQRGRAQVAQ